MFNPLPTTPPIELSGMIYHECKYTAEQWKEKTGHDPSLYPDYFQFTRYGLVATRKLYRDHCDYYFACKRYDRIFGLGLSG